MNLTRTVAPTLEVVSLATAKAHLRVDHSDDDALIAGYIAAAIDHLDGWQGVLGYCIGVQTWRLTLDTFPATEIDIPLGPLLSVTAVEYRAEAGEAYTTLDAAEYEVDLGGSRVIPLSTWPTAGGTNGVRVTFTAGHATADGLDAVKATINLLVGHWYANREAVGDAKAELPLGAVALIGAKRRMVV